MTNSQRQELLYSSHIKTDCIAYDLITVQNVLNGCESHDQLTETRTPLFITHCIAYDLITVQNVLEGCESHDQLTETRTPLFCHR